MIRFFILVILPLIAPYVCWYLWRIFAARPKMDPATGDQLMPEFDSAPKGWLLMSAVALMVFVIGGFLLVHDEFQEDPYRAIDVEEYERREAGQN